MKALVVDDSMPIRRMLAGILQNNCGFKELSQAASGEEALEILGTETFDLVLLDWRMPTLSGIEVLKVMRGKGNETPVIMVTSEAGREQVLEAVSAGANSYIIKPLRAETIVTKVRAVMQKRSEE